MLFVGIDCAATAANGALAQEAAIRAFPTFHMYLGMQRRAEMVGADMVRLQALVQQHTPPAPAQQHTPPAGAAAHAPAAAPVGTLAA